MPPEADRPIGAGSPPPRAELGGDDPAAVLGELPVDDPLYHHFFHHCPDLFGIAGRDGYLRAFNPAWERLLGWSREELLSRPFLEFVHPGDYHRSRAEVRRLMEGGPPTQFENRYLTRDGSFRWLLWNTYMGTDRPFLYGVGRDITERKRSEVEMVDETLALDSFSSRLKELHQLTTQVYQSLDELLDETLATGCRIFGLGTGCVLAVDGDLGRVVAARSTDQSLAQSLRVGGTFPIGDTSIEEVIRQGRSRAWPRGDDDRLSADGDHGDRPAVLPWAPGRPIETLLCAPIFLESLLFGTLSFSSPRPVGHRFFRHDLEIVELIADRIGRLIAKDQADQARLEALAEQRKFVALVEQSDDFIAMADLEGNTVYINQAGLDLVGLEGDEAAQGRPIREYLTEEAWGMVRDRALPGALEKGFWHGEFQLRHFITGEVIESQGSLFRVSDPETGEPLCLATVQRDVRETRRVERLKREFISTVSHELRTPLTSIHGALSLLVSGKVGELPEPALGLMAMAAKNSDTLVRLIHDLLDSESLESGTMQFRPQRLDGVALTSQAVETNRLYARRYGVELRLERADAEAAGEGAEPLWIDADPDRLSQVLTNLLSNAAKHSPSGETVLVTLRPVAPRLAAAGRSGIEGAPEGGAGAGAAGEADTPEDRLPWGRLLRIEVTDRGPGVPPELRREIFQRFVRLSSPSMPRREGSGLGLFIASTLTERSGGTLTLETPEDGGARFVVTLPLSDPPDGASGGEP